MEFDPTLIHDWLSRAARRNPAKEAIVCEQDRWTYGRLDACSDLFAQGLIRLGMQRQDRVVILLGNCPETVVSLYGTLKAGGVFVVLDVNTRARRLRHILQDSAAKILVARASQASVVCEAFDGLGDDLRVVWLGEERIPDIPCVTWDGLLSGSSGGGRLTRPSSCAGFHRSIDLDLAAIVYTSATTGAAKGVMCTHCNVVSAARSIIQYLDNTEQDVLLNVLPLSFSYGLYQVLTSCIFGGTVVLERCFLYPHVTLTRIAQEKVTGLPLVPSVAAIVLHMDDISRYDFSTLRYITSAGAALPVRHLRRLRGLVPQARLFNMYGLTECVRVCYLTGAELDDHPASVGRPMPNCEVRIVDDDGDDVAAGETGELLVRGANVMQGYWGDPEMSVSTCRPAGYSASRWLRSGDYFRMDTEGRLYFHGRKDDMIKTHGKRVSPREVEDVICEMEDVIEAAVIGVPDGILGQTIKAFVVSRADRFDKKAVLRHCVNRLEPVMVPKYVELVPAIPKTVRGKTDRRELQAMGTR